MPSFENVTCVSFEAEALIAARIVVPPGQRLTALALPEMVHPPH